MRRVSIGILLLIVTPSITQAYCSNISQRYRVRYSPHAFSYRSNGLVPGGVTYSPYAFGPGTSGLVFEGVRYSPYAFGYSESGLILDYYLWPIPYVSYCPPYPPHQVYREYDGAPPCHKSTDARQNSNRDPQYNRRTTHTVQQAGTNPASPSTRRPAQARQDDAMTVIRQHLRDEGIHDAQINRILRVDNKLVSVDFTLTDRNLLIKYWDPEQMESLSANSAFNRRAIEKYRKDWERFAGDYQRTGGRIYAVSVPDREDIVAALRSCDELGPGDDSSDQGTMYARN